MHLVLIRVHFLVLQNENKDSKSVKRGRYRNFIFAL